MEHREILETFKLTMIVSAVICLGVLAGCENTFEPDGENHIEIDLPNPPVATINLNTFDPIINYLITEPTQFIFSIDVPELIVYESQVQIHDQILFQEADDSGSFIVNPNHIPDGDHMLVIESRTNAGSGSIADQLELEGFNYIYEVPLTSIGSEPLESFGFIGTALDSGDLRVIWNQSQRNLFEEYVIYGRTDLYRTSVIDDTSFIDPNYIGGYMNYHMNVRIDQTTFSNIWFSQYRPLPTITSFEKLPGRGLKVHWSQCEFPANFLSYRVHGLSSSVNEFFNIMDTTMTVSDVPFGSAILAKIYTMSKSPSLSSEYHQYSIETPVWVGDSTGVTFTKVAYDPDIDRLVIDQRVGIHGNHRMKIVDAESLELIVEKSTGSYNFPVISPTGKRAVSFDDDQISVYNMNSLEVSQTLDLSSLVGLVTRVYSVAVSDGGDVFAVAVVNDTLNLCSLPISNPSEITRIAINDGVNYPYYLFCTSDGQYIAHNNTIYSFMDRELEAIDDRFYAGQLIFDPYGDRMVSWDGFGQLQIWDFPPQNVLHNLKLATYPRSHSIDPISGKMGAQVWDNGNKYQVINLETGTIENQIPVSDVEFLLYNNNILSEDGYRIPAFE